MAYKFKISKSGYNVLTETNPDNLIYSSDYDTLKYYSSGNVTLEVNAGEDEKETSITHSLGYIPVFIAYLELDFSVGSGYWSQVPYNFEDFSTRVNISASADTTKLYFGAYNTNDVFASIDLNFHYKIFRNDTGL